MASDFSFLNAELTTESAQAPAWPVFGAAACALCACVLVFFGSDDLMWSAAGYLMGALVVPTLVVVYRFGRRTAAQNPFYIPRIGLERVVLIVLLVGIIAGGANAWFVATELAKQ